ncbi:MAG: radical SAM protein [Clostridia bacterium]|nr:radical SAM protein [Clostridia bacterium]
MSTSWSQLNDKIMEQAAKKKVPVVGQFELTPRCNLQCKMCYICRRENDYEILAEEISAHAWIQLAAGARDAGMLYLLLTGGEVFLRQDFKTIYEEISMMGFVTEIFTNATLITPQVAKWLGRIPPSKVAVSIYGASPETYRVVCGSASSYERTVRGIDLLLSEGITVDLRTTIIKGNKNDFTKLADFAEKRNLEFGIVNYISPRREKGDTSPEAERLSPDELAEFEVYVQSYYQDKDPDKKENEQTFESCSDNTAADRLKISYLPDNSCESFRCTAGHSSFWITWNGQMIPCGQVNTPTVSLIKNNFSEAWTKLQRLCSRVPACKECDICSLSEYCMSCPAVLEAETGAFDKPSPYLCELAKKRMNLKLINKNT